jgi:hypothetical protein
VREFCQRLIAAIFVGTILMVFAFLTGITPEGLVYGKWPPADDHATNWTDTVLHPSAPANTGK